MGSGVTRPLGGVELGGTKIVCALGTADAILAETRIQTGPPAATLAAVATWFEEQEPAGLAALGVAAFGPVELRPGHPRFGYTRATPKPGWSDIDVAGALASRLGVEVAFDTDVNAAALAEGRLGAARGVGSFVYLTVGTGVGGGGVVDGRLVHGLVHPEMGHVSVPRQPGDDFAGACPYHGACLEGMAAGRALEARFGAPPAELVGEERRRAAELSAAYVASGLANVVYVLAPERIVIGGGVSLLPGFVETAQALLREDLGGYPGLPEHEHDFVVPAGLGQEAGIRGALILAEGVLT
jgi:fructokinase